MEIIKRQVPLDKLTNATMRLFSAVRGSQTYESLLVNVRNYYLDFGEFPASIHDLHARPIITIEQAEEEYNIIYEDRS